MEEPFLFWKVSIFFVVIIVQFLPMFFKKKDIDIQLVQVPFGKNERFQMEVGHMDIFPFLFELASC